MWHFFITLAYIIYYKLYTHIVLYVFIYILCLYMYVLLHCTPTNPVVDPIGAWRDLGSSAVSKVALGGPGWE